MTEYNVAFTFYFPAALYAVDCDSLEPIKTRIDEHAEMMIYPPTTTDAEFEYWRGRDMAKFNSMRVYVEVKGKETAPSEEILRDLHHEADKRIRGLIRWFRFYTDQYIVNHMAMFTCDCDYPDNQGKRHKKFILNWPPFEPSISEPPVINKSIWERLEAQVSFGKEPPLAKELLLDAKLYLAMGDKRMAVVAAAAGIEFVTKERVARYLSENLKGHAKASKSQMRDFIKDESSKFLLTIWLGLCSSVSSEVREECSVVRDLRNQVMHVGKRAISFAEARKAVLSLERLMSEMGN